MRKSGVLLFLSVFMSVSLVAQATDIYDPGSTVTNPDDFVFTVGWSNPFLHSTLSTQPPGVDETGVRGEWTYCLSTQDP
ncbi:MAG: hypothetical protein RLZZ07_645, partial [Actinomycetota bacterium]